MIKILYEDKDILAIDKPSGISVHPSAMLRTNSDNKKEKFVTDWVLKNYPKMKNVGEPAMYNGVEIKRPGIVHRLDKDTSGVLILAKNQKSYEFIKEQFQNREVKKVYYALAQGKINKDKFIIDKPIGRSPNDFRKRLAGRGARGELREAITEFKVLKRFKDFTFLEVHPKTGRTHQIRVHLKSISHPVVCDGLYNSKGICPKDIDRLALHSLSIEIKNPKGETLKIESTLPKEFKKFLK
ncbi:RluA family pseudouridine synthase [Candidatus Nomurabacteria bacterium]|nr:RluA family pseudouridine synthase [Candidatus Nomurabacteria bacterium]